MTSFEFAAYYVREYGFPLSDYVLPPVSKNGIMIKNIVHPKGSDLDVISFRMAILSGVKPMRIKLEKPWKQTSIYENEKLWMTTIPIETFTHLYPIHKAHGHVLIGGLGLGYVAHEMLAKNRSVKSITVVESNKNLIDVVKPHFLSPKIEIIHGDIFNALKLTTKYFDFIYLDIWRSTGETEFYQTVIPLRKLAKKVISNSSSEYRRQNIICWMEDEMRGQVENGLKSMILLSSEEELQKMVDTDIKFLKEWKPVFLKMLKKVTIKELKAMPDSVLSMICHNWVKDYGV